MCPEVSHPSGGAEVDGALPAPAEWGKGRGREDSGGPGPRVKDRPLPQESTLVSWAGCGDANMTRIL